LTKMYFHLNVTLLIVCSTTALALSITQPPTMLNPTNLTSINNNNPKPTGDWECRSGGSAFLHRPKIQDCGLAILKLPRTDSTGAFHSNGVADEFKLPLVRTEGTCSVRVAIVDGWKWQETGDWREVATEAAALWYGCKAAVVDSWFIGASTTVGRQGKIDVTLQYYGGNADEA